MGAKIEIIPYFIHEKAFQLFITHLLHEWSVEILLCFVECLQCFVFLLFLSFLFLFLLHFFVLFCGVCNTVKQLVSETFPGKELSLETSKHGTDVLSFRCVPKSSIVGTN